MHLSLPHYLASDVDSLQAMFAYFWNWQYWRPDRFWHLRFATVWKPIRKLQGRFKLWGGYLTLKHFSFIVGHLSWRNLLRTKSWEDRYINLKCVTAMPDSYVVQSQEKPGKGLVCYAMWPHGCFIGWELLSVKKQQKQTKKFELVNLAELVNLPNPTA